MTIQTASKYSPIIRQNGHNSLQPRFQNIKPNQFFRSLFRFLRTTDIQEEPEYGSRERDAWLNRVWKLEPYLAGVISSVVSVDKNRGWTVTGGRNQVKRFVNILHNNFYFAPDLSGWRMSFGGLSQAYYTSDLGAITEIGREGTARGRLDSLYYVDPAKCYLTGDFEEPLKYNDAPWKADDYFRVVSMPDTNEDLYGLGFCALSRCIELAKIMIGIYQYDNEMLLNHAPRGLLLLKGITQDQWVDSLASREARLKANSNEYYGAVEVLATVDPGIELEAQLVSLSQLPAEFDQKTFTDLLMYGYALVFGYDPREFWPVSAGALGTATETEAQHRKAGAKGGLDFVLGFAEMLNEEIPDTVLFEFEERDLDGEQAQAEVEQAQADVVTSLYESGLREGAPLISREEARILLAEDGLIDSEWTENQEDTVATDEGTERALQNERIQRAIWKYPDEPIVQYKFSVENGRERHRYTTIAKPQRRRRSFLVTRMIRRQIEDELDIYQRQLDTLSEQALNDEISQSDYEERLEAATLAILTLSIIRGTGASNDAAELLSDTAIMLLDDMSQDAIDVALDVLTDQALLQDALSPDALAKLQSEVTGSLQSSLANDIYAGNYDDNVTGLLERLGMWGTTAIGLYGFGRVISNPTANFRWTVGNTDHCSDCAGFDGQIKTGQEWRDGGLFPQGRSLECKGYNCQCSLDEV